MEKIFLFIFFFKKNFGGWGAKGIGPPLTGSN